MLASSCSQLEWLSPSQMPPYRWLPMMLERLYSRVRLPGRRSAKASPGSAGHAAAVQIVHPVVPHLLPGQVVVEAGVVGRAVHQAHGTAHYLAEELFLFDVVLPAQLSHTVQEFPQPVRRIEQRGFVHVVPEALNTAVGQHLVAVAEPIPHFRA